MMPRTLYVLSILTALVLSARSQSSDETAISIREPLRIKTSVVLTEKDRGRPIIVEASGITIDGNNIEWTGVTGDPKTFRGDALYSSGHSNVTLVHFKARGWETGLHVVDGSNWNIEHCDLSDNFHDPDFGWGENGRRGGILFERVTKSTIRQCNANRVWDACTLVQSDDNIIESNDFSYASNTCLKFWTACNNQVLNNNLSHGIRIAPKEVHARDSTSVLIESGSDRNRFIGNDCTYGGDGIFVRVLNGWCSVDNRFERNDCSYANNNGFECWAERNVFVDNKANHCSYGFWLGGSDQTRLENNEASYNGLATGQHNSPHLPNQGHAGIVFMFGPSSHVVARGNRCVGNNGAGIAIIGDQPSRGSKWKAYHWILEQNTLQDNRWGIYTQYADWIVVAHNQFKNNSLDDIRQAEGVTRLTVDQVESQRNESIAIDGDAKPFRAYIDGPQSIGVGKPLTLTARTENAIGNSVSFAWDLGDGTHAHASTISHVFNKPGFYRVGVNANDNGRTELAWLNLYVVESVLELGTEQQAQRWSIEDYHDQTRSNDQSSVATFTNSVDHLIGSDSLQAIIQPYAGFRAMLTCDSSGLPIATKDLTNKSRVSFWMKAVNEDVTGWQGGPFVAITSVDGTKYWIEPTPKTEWMRNAEYNEARMGWRHVRIPLAGNDQWVCTGTRPTDLNSIAIGVDSWGAPKLRIWIDGLTIE